LKKSTTAKIIAGLLCIALTSSVLFLGACSSGDNDNDNANKNGTTPIRFLSIEGDVREYRSFNTGVPVKNDEALPGDEDFEGVLLRDFLADSEPTRDDYTVDLISSGDGFRVKLFSVDNVYIIFSDISGWTVIAPDHPVSANAKDINRIIVFAGDNSITDESDPGLKLSLDNGDFEIIPLGYLLVMAKGIYTDWEEEVGSVSSDSVVVSTIKTSFRLQDIEKNIRSDTLTENKIDETIEVITADGKRYLTDSDMVEFVIYRQKISCIDYYQERPEVYEDVVEVRLK